MTRDSSWLGMHGFVPCCLVPLLFLLSTPRQVSADLLYSFDDNRLPPEIHGGWEKVTDGVLTLEGPGGVVWSYIGGTSLFPNRRRSILS